jgi:sulfite reductase alpha subunit-like flavoprotein
MQLHLMSTGIKHNVGNHVYILPRNDPKRVSQFLQWYGVSGDHVVSITPTDNQPMEFPPILSIQELFTQYIDLFAPVTRKFIQNMAHYARDPRDNMEIISLLSPQKKQELAVFCQENQYDECLKRWDSSVPPIQNLISILPLIQPRAYSIASSSKVSPNVIDLCVALDLWSTPGGKTGHGLASGYLIGLDHTQSPLIPIRMGNGLLVPPQDPTVPIILVGLGTGIAPFRGFLQERAFLKSQGTPLGPSVMYFGCHKRKQDFLFAEEFDAFVREGVLSNIVCAFSHEQEKRIYVQNKILEDPATPAALLQLPNTVLYYCGPAQHVSEEVLAALQKCLTLSGAMSVEQAAEHMKKMEIEKRIHIESPAIKHMHGQKVSHALAMRRLVPKL